MAAGVERIDGVELEAVEREGIAGDPISLAALAIPMTLLYILSIGIGWIVQRRRRKEPVAAAAP